MRASKTIQHQICDIWRHRACSAKNNGVKIKKRGRLVADQNLAPFSHVIYIISISLRDRARRRHRYAI